MLSELLEPAPTMRSAALPAAPTTPQTAVNTAAPSTGLETTLVPVAPPPVTRDSLEVGESAGTIHTDTASWEPAVARTWVNVRSDAGRGGDVVGIIKPAERAMLGGESRAGWRQVKAPDMSGWVDPRLFESDSLRTRG